MLEILTDQQESDDAFRRWADAMTAGSKPNASGWVIEGVGIAFRNDRPGKPTVITDQVRLGVDSQFHTGIVRIAQPNTAKADRGKQTVIGRDRRGRLFLLREGCLQANPLSRRIDSDFALLTGLKDVSLAVSGKKSLREWYIVADLSSPPSEIVSQTSHFTLACARARCNAGGALIHPIEDEAFGYGADEHGQIITVTVTGSTKEVCKLQGYVSEALREAVGNDVLKKPTKNGFAADGLIASSKILIEIKTGTSAHDIYEAVGQLALYPALIGLLTDLKKILLIPDQPALKPVMAAALNEAGVKVYTYTIGKANKIPEINFSKAFIDFCRSGSV